MSKRILSMLMTIVLIVSCVTVVPAEEAAEEVPVEEVPVLPAGACPERAPLALKV